MEHHDGVETEQPSFSGGYLEYTNMKTATEMTMMNFTPLVFSISLSFYSVDEDMRFI